MVSLEILPPQSTAGINLTRVSSFCKYISRKSSWHKIRERLNFRLRDDRAFLGRVGSWWE